MQLSYIRIYVSRVLTIGYFLALAMISFEMSHIFFSSYRLN